MELTKKRCSKCKRVKEFSEFHKNRNKKSGLNHQCKNCVSILGKKYWEKKKEKKKHYFYSNWKKNQKTKLSSLTVGERKE